MMDNSTQIALGQTEVVEMIISKLAGYDLRTCRFVSKIFNLESVVLLKRTFRASIQYADDVEELRNVLDKSMYPGTIFKRLNIDVAVLECYHEEFQELLSIYGTSLRKVKMTYGYANSRVQFQSEIFEIVSMVLKSCPNLICMELCSERLFTTNFKTRKLEIFFENQMKLKKIVIPCWCQPDLVSYFESLLGVCLKLHTLVLVDNQNPQINDVSLVEIIAHHSNIKLNWLQKFEIKIGYGNESTNVMGAPKDLLNQISRLNVFDQLTILKLADTTERKGTENSKTDLIKILKKCLYLQHLELNGKRSFQHFGEDSDETIVDLSPFPELLYLKTIKIKSGNAYAIRALSFFGQCPSLSKLKLDIPGGGVIITPSEFFNHRYDTHRGIKKIKIEASALADVGFLSSFLCFVNLRVVDTVSTTSVPETIIALAKLKTLETLIIRAVVRSPRPVLKTFMNFKEFPSLKSITFISAWSSCEGSILHASALLKALRKTGVGQFKLKMGNYTLTGKGWQIKRLIFFIRKNGVECVIPGLNDLNFGSQILEEQPNFFLMIL